VKSYTQKITFSLGIAERI